ncbi:MAG: MBL fold metallo-hydrolase [Actinomycetota bacterium]|nr:MBL fold metallo-hydrolase [Actinomycetota bacterium]
MKLTEVGSSASYAGPGQACSGHLVQEGDTNVLLDCGNGALANLAHVIDPIELDAVFITHEHPDHFLDVYALWAMLNYAPQGPAGPIDLIVPAGLGDTMKGLLGDRGRSDFDAAFRVRALVPGETIQVGRLAITPHQVEHTDASFALAVQGATSRMCYTSDTAATDPVRQAAQGCDLLLAEATLPEEYAGRAPHMTARQAAEIARDAGAGQLVLTHIWPTNDRIALARDAKSVFSGPVHVAREMDEFQID